RRRQDRADPSESPAPAPRIRLVSESERHLPWPPWEAASSTLMSTRRVGLWLIGAFGGVGSTAALGLSALSRGLSDTTGLTTALPFFDGADLDPFSAFVLGGHDIRRSSFHQAALDLHLRANVFDSGAIATCKDQLD